MFGKIQDKLDGICIAAKNRLHRFVKETEGMETLQVIIIIAVALGVAGDHYSVLPEVAEHLNGTLSIPGPGELLIYEVLFCC